MGEFTQGFKNGQWQKSPLAVKIFHYTKSNAVFCRCIAFFLCHVCQNTPTLWKLLIYTELELRTARQKRRCESTSWTLELASLGVVCCNLFNNCTVCGVDLFIAKLFVTFHLQVLLLAIYIHWCKYIMQEMVNNETINSAVLFTDACWISVQDVDMSSNRRRLLCWTNRAWVMLSRKF